MSPGPVEEAGSTARSLIDALKAQPAVLGLLAVIVALLLFIFYALHTASAAREKLTTQVFENGKLVQEILSHCVIPQRNSYTTEPLKPIDEPVGLAKPPDEFVGPRKGVD